MNVILKKSQIQTCWSVLVGKSRKDRISGDFSKCGVLLCFCLVFFGFFFLEAGPGSPDCLCGPGLPPFQLRVQNRWKTSNQMQGKAKHVIKLSKGKALIA